MLDRNPPWIWRRQEGVFLALALLGGIAVRCAFYFDGRSLWLDEAMLAWSVINRGYSALTGPLAYLQAAPIGFLFLAKASTNLFGNHELALRLPSLLAGLLSIFLFYFVCKHYFDQVSETCVPVAFFAFCPPLIYYAAELKQYSTETAVALALFLLAARLARHPAKSRVAALALGGAVGVWFSFSCCLVLAGVGSTLLFQAGRDRSWPRFKGLCLAAGLWLASFAVYYHFSIAALSKNSSTLAFHADAFLPLIPRSLHDLKILHGAYLDVLENPAGFEFRMTGLAFFLVVLGAVFQARRDAVGFCLAVLPIAFTLLASALGKYPFTGRLILFLAPNFLLLLSAGIIGLSKLAGRRSGAIAMFAFLLLLQSLAASAVSRPFTTYREDIKPALQSISSKPSEYDALYVYSFSIPAFDYYQKACGFSFKGVIRGASPDGPEGFPPLLRELDALPKSARTWAVFSHIYWSPAETAMVEERLTRGGALVKRFFAPGCNAYLVAR